MEFKHPKYYAEMRKLARAQAAKLTSSQAPEHKPSSPEPRVQASSPSPQAPGSCDQGTSGSVQASRNRKQG